ncbi:MAG: hypothetical protein JSS49_03965 [Planctomycetes bacterium]|nr:hypothetical protein [Planctomycetota bacterium]
MTVLQSVSRYRVWLWVVAVNLLFASGGFQADGGEIADLHQKWVRPKAVDSNKQKAHFGALGNPTHGVTEIGLERTACHGTCPIYTVVFKADGTFRYVGEDHVTRKGKHTGRVSPDQFNRLAEYLIESGYMSLDATYDLPEVADFPTTYTMAIVDTKRKLVKNYGDLGPIKLWALQQSIDALLAEAEWDRADGAVSPPDKRP